MNYLAHLYFSAPTPLAWAGSLLGDFIKGPVPSRFPDELAMHLWLHRRLDSYTVASPSFQRSRNRLDPRFRYARSVLVDVFYDHFLARNWGQYSQQPLEEFAQQVYRGLQDCFDLLTEPLQLQLPRMIEHDWLTSYQHPDVVQRVLERLEERLKHKFPLAEGFIELERWQPGLERDFADFILEVQQQMPAWQWPGFVSNEMGERT